MIPDLANFDKQAFKEMKTAVLGNNQFAFDLYDALRAQSGNLFFSPYSISSALAMTYAGAGGSTASQMAQTLHFAQDQDKLHSAFAFLNEKLEQIQERGFFLLNVANALWTQKRFPLLEEYLALIKKYYQSDITPLDYSDPEKARRTINAWVAKKTGRKIMELLSPGMITPTMRLVLTNTIYFNGQWNFPFDRAQTETAPFWVTPEESVQVPFMFQKEEFKIAELDRLQMLKLSYLGNSLAMLIILPRKGVPLSDIEKALTPETLKEWSKKLWDAKVKVYLPRFKLECQFRLSATLMSMGMSDAFDENKADFSGMDGRKHWLYLSDVVHKALVDVNEEGTEAAAASADLFRTIGLISRSVTFRADHPFIFLIRENLTGNILFLGRVINPM